MQPYLSKYRKVTVFGGSNPPESEYQHAVRLGQMLAEVGCTVLTGGYIGTMEAVSRGAAGRGAHVIGVTCDEIESWRPVKPNRWVGEERRFPSLRLRLFELIEVCDAALALPGGLGTLAEISIMWNHLLTGAISPRPLVLIGTGWQATFGQFFQSLGAYVPESQRGWVSYVSDVDSAVRLLLAGFS